MWTSFNPSALSETSRPAQLRKPSFRSRPSLSSYLDLSACSEGFEIDPLPTGSSFHSSVASTGCSSPVVEIDFDAYANKSSKSFLFVPMSPSPQANIHPALTSPLQHRSNRTPGWTALNRKASDLHITLQPASKRDTPIHPFAADENTLSRRRRNYEKALREDYSETSGEALDSYFGTSKEVAKANRGQYACIGRSKGALLAQPDFSPLLKDYARSSTYTTAPKSSGRERPSDQGTKKRPTPLDLTSISSLSTLSASSQYQSLEPESNKRTKTTSRQPLPRSISSMVMRSVKSVKSFRKG